MRLRELAEPEMLNKDTLLMPKVGADHRGWLPYKDTLPMLKVEVDHREWFSDKDTLPLLKVGADHREWFSDKDTLLIKQINLNPFLLTQWLRYRLSNDSLLRNSLYIMSATC